MKIKSCTVTIEWEDGTKEEVSSYLPAGTWGDLENFMDYWEEQNNEGDQDEI